MTVGVLNVMGRVFMPTVDDPFRVAREMVDMLRDQTQVIVVDVHAEATSEKMAMARFLDGQVSLVFGSHTHVQTADEQILTGGTAYITDVGMTGPSDGVIGMETAGVLQRFTQAYGERFSVQKTGPRQFCAVLATVEVAIGPRARREAHQPAGPGMIVDFHSHTRESDGALPPEELVAMMRARGVRIFSITDHDTMRAYGQFAAEFATVVPGIEINTTWNDNEVHVLGYGLPLGDDTPLANVSGREPRVPAHAHRPHHGEPHRGGLPAHACRRRGAIRRRRCARPAARRQGADPEGLGQGRPELLRQLLVRGKPGYMPSNYITPEQAIDVIRSSGGIRCSPIPAASRTRRSSTS